MKQLFIYLLSVCLICSHAYATIASGEDKISLNGTWKFRIIENTSEVLKDSTFTSWDSLSVPGNWDTENKYAHHKGKAAYYRTFTVPEAWSESKVRIHFDAVYQHAEIYVNGFYLGHHTGGYTPFEFLVQDHLKFNEPNEVLVIADNSYGRGAWWTWGGISRDVTLVRNNEVRIKNLKVIANPDLSSKSASITVIPNIENLQYNRDQFTVEVVISEFQTAGTNSPAMPAFRKKFLLGQMQTKEFRLDTIINNVNLWHFDRPNLYHVEARIYAGSDLLHSKKERFGIRKVEVKGSQLLLNGEPIRANGFNRVHDHRFFGNTEPDELIKKDIDLMKSMGSVITRMMHAPLAPNMLDYLDEKGMLVICEIPLWGREEPHAFTNNPIAKAWMEEMIIRDFNHPSIIGWSVGNEIDKEEKKHRNHPMAFEQFKYITDMMNYVREQLDSSRLLTYVSMTAQRGPATPENDPAGFCDMICFNSYGDFLNATKAVHAKWPDKPIFLSEFGRGQIGEGLDAKLDSSTINQINKLGELKYLVGASLWTFNDYRSAYPGTPASENRAWGVVDVWRQPKKAAVQIQKANAPVKDIVVQTSQNGSLQLTVVPKDKMDLPSYVLKGYSLKVETIGTNAKAINIVNLPLQEIKPGDNQFEVKNQIKVTGEVHQITVHLVNPLGYSLLEIKKSIKSPAKAAILSINEGVDKARIRVKPAAGAEGYKLYYGNNFENSIETTTEFIEIPVTNSAQQVKVLAFNSLGEGESSKVFTIKSGSKPLPPKIIFTQTSKNNLIIGYSVDKNDDSFVLQYGNSETELSKEIKTNLKGSVKINNLAPGTYFLRIKSLSKSGESDWSETQKIVIPKV